MWTPKRVLLLALGFVVFCTAYVGYAEVLGSIDGLPALPEQYWPGSPPPPPEGSRTERPVEVKLQQAFGIGCQELKMLIQVESPQRVVIASNDCVFERGGREVRLTPISIAFFGKLVPNKDPEINTIRAATAILTLDQPISGPLDMGKRRIVEAELRGFKSEENPKLDIPIFIRNNRRTLRQDDDIQIKIPFGPVYFNDENRLIHTNDVVELRDFQSKPETKITATGLDVHLTPNAKPGSKPGPTKPKPEGNGPTTVERIVLLSDVDMHLYNEAGAGFPGLSAAAVKPEVKPGQPKPPPAPKDHIWITTAGKFAYDLAQNHGRFDIPERESPLAPELVTVRRNPESDKSDMLECEHLELQFRRKPEGVAQPPTPPPATEGQGPNLEIDWIHAWGNKLHLDSRDQNVKAWGDDLVYQALTHTTVIKGEPEARLTKDEDKIHAHELEMIQDKEKGTQKVTARGKGSIHMWDKTAKKHIRHARWYEQFTSTKDGVQDLLTFKGNAALVEDETLLPDEVFNDNRILAAKTLLKADDLQIWLDPAPPPPAHPTGAPTVPVKPSAPTASRPGEMPESSGGRRPRHVEATGHVIARTPEMHILEQPATKEQAARSTQQLSIFFKDVADPAGPLPAGPSPQPPTTIAAAPGNTLPQPAPATGPAPIVVPGAPNKPEPQPATKTEPQPAKPSRPVELSASFITAHVFRYDGTGKTELDQLDTEGAVRVVQEPSADDNGFIIRGDKLELKRQSTGNHLKVTSDSANLAELHMDRLIVVGPEIEVDQGDNTARVEGDGFMKMENTTDFQGNPLKKPEWLTVYWKRLMRFEGSFAEFHGDIEAEQAHSRLRCQMLQVYFDKPVTLSDQRSADKKDRPKGQEPARAKKLLCDRSVKVEEEAYEVRYKLTDKSLTELRDAKVPETVLVRLAILKDRDYDSRDRFSAEFGKLLGKDELEKFQSLVVSHATYEPDPRRLTGFKSLDCLELMVMNLERTMTAEGPGMLRIVQPGGGGPGAALGGPAPAPKTPAKPGPKPPEEWTLTLVTYGRFGDGLGKNTQSAGRMDADNNTHTATFYEDVQVLHIPWTSDPKKLREAINVAATLEKLPIGGLYMECRKKLKVYSPEEETPGKPPAGDSGTGKHIMTGTGQVYLKATDAKGQLFWGVAEVVHYDEEKEMVKFDGGPGALAEVYQVERRDEAPKKTTAQTIIYYRKTGKVDVEGGTNVSGTH